MPKHCPSSPHLGLPNMRSSKVKRDWHEIMLFVCGVVVFFTAIFHSLAQNDEIQKLKKDLNSCQFYQEFVVEGFE